MPTVKSSFQQSTVSQYALLLPQTHHQNSKLQHRLCYQRPRCIIYWHSEWLLLWNGCMLSKTVIPRKQKWKGEFKLQICIFSNWGHWNFQHLTGFDLYLLLMTNNVHTVSAFKDMGLHRSQILSCSLYGCMWLAAISYAANSNFSCSHCLLS